MRVDSASSTQKVHFDNSIVAYQQDRQHRAISDNGWRRPRLQLKWVACRRASVFGTADVGYSDGIGLQIDVYGPAYMQLRRTLAPGASCRSGGASTFRSDPDG